MKLLLHELADQPFQILAAIGTIVCSTVAAVVGLISQIGQDLITEAPSWFLGFVATVIVALAWAVVTLARYAANTQKTSNDTVATSIANHTSELKNLQTLMHDIKEVLARQNEWFESVGVTAVHRALDNDEETVPAIPGPGLHAARRNRL